MVRFVNPGSVAAPGSLYSHGAVHDLKGQRIVVSGQVGVRPDGTMSDDLAEQIEIAWDNLTAALAEAGFSTGDILKITAFAAAPGAAAPFRESRARRLGSHAPATTFVQVAALVDPRWLFEIEAEAVRGENEA